MDDQTAGKLGQAAAPAPVAPSANGITLAAFPVQGQCWFGDTWQAPRGGGRLHEGLDVIAPAGKQLYAVVDGVISKQYVDYPGALSGNGFRVSMPNGTYFTYLHMSSFAEGLGVGSPVRAGQVIGYVGATGNAATPHLHFEVHPSGGAAVNPYPLVKAVDACSNSAAR
jgi:murein DD-endopeptidase MepM/ murein hydrolase activator NlpD